MALIKSFCKIKANTPTVKGPTIKMRFIKTTPGASSWSATTKIYGEPIKYIKLIKNELNLILRKELTEESLKDKFLSIRFNN